MISSNLLLTSNSDKVRGWKWSGEARLNQTPAEAGVEARGHGRNVVKSVDTYIFSLNMIDYSPFRR